MLGLDPSIHRSQHPMDARLKAEHDEWVAGEAAWLQNIAPPLPSGMARAWVYILASQRHGTLYIGVTSNLPRRIWEHREGLADGFTMRYGIKHLVYAEAHDEIAAAIQRETSLKRWRRAWKIALIEASNPGWTDLYDALN